MVLRHPEITRRRVSLLRAAVESSVEVDRAPLAVAMWAAAGEPVAPAEAWVAPYQPCQVGCSWGPAWTTTWFRLTGTIPPAWAGRPVLAAIDLTGETAGDAGFSAEGLVYRDGDVLQGLSPMHQHVVLSDKAGGGEVVELHVEAAANPRLAPGHPALLARAEPSGPPLFRLGAAHLVLHDSEAAAVAHDLRVLDELLGALPDDDPRAAGLLLALNDAANALDPDDVRGSLGRLRSRYEPALQRPAHASAHRITAVGHAHIDSAWLWPVRESRRKVARTFSTALALMEQYPDYHFAASQPAQYEWIRTDHPGLFARLRERVDAGQWEPVGAMYVEADCNLSGGESLVRQLVTGKRWFREHLGHDTREVWLPDVFGYAANLPQLFRLAGIDFFLTQKLSWNQFNRLPNQTFWWEGIDGSAVLTHFPPADTYNGSFAVGEVVESARRHRDPGRSDHSLYLFGWGDGGGGPTAQMIESARRLGNLEGAPRVEMGRVSGAASAMREGSRDLVTWCGELYFELHRGTYTSQARTKLGNRRCQEILRDAEMLAAVTGRGDHAARDLLARSWRSVLFNQFHDIIPGSSIAWVHEETERDHATVLAEAGALRDDCLADAAGSPSSGDAEAPDSVVLVNTGLARRSVVEVPLVAGDPPAAAVGGVAPAQCWSVGEGPPRQLLPADLPAHGATAVRLTSGTAARGGSTARAMPDLLENDILRIHLDGDGLLDSILDKRSGREVVAPGGRGNVLELHEDRPLDWDAWDLEVYHRETARPITPLASVEVVATGPLRAALRQVRTVGRSRICQLLTLDAGSALLRVVTEVDWQEEHRLLTAAFAVDVHAPAATYEVQFGAVQRPTHFNTTWDLARFEVCAQRWADLSDARHGVALLNDCKHGYDIHGNVMRLSLLRSPRFPDPTADRGLHRFTYGLLPHPGTWQEGGVLEAADELNRPVLVRRGSGRGAPLGSWFEVEGPGVLLSAVAFAEDTPGVLVRLYEAFGGSTTARLRTVLAFDEALVVDLLEREVAPLQPGAGGWLTLPLRGFEVVTVLLRGAARPGEGGG